MAWPTNKPDSNAFVSDTNSIKESRPELNTMSQAVNDIVDYVDTAAEANGYILQYNSGTGKLEYVPNNAAIDINGNNGITVTQPSSGGHDIEFSGTYDAGNITYTLASSQLELLGSGSITPTIKSTSTGSEKGLALQTGGTPTSQISMSGGSPGDISILPGGTGNTYIDSDLYLGPLNTDVELNTRGSGNLRIATDSGAGALIQLIKGTNGDILIEPSGTGKVKIQNQYYLPDADGTAGQFIKTDGAGNLSFAPATSGSISPLTADLETDGYNIIGNNGELNLFIDGNDSAGAPGVKLGTTNTHVLVNQGGISHIGTNGPQLTITPHDTINYSQIFMAGSNSITADNRILVQAHGALEINRLNFPYNLAPSASVGQVLRVASINNAGIFNNNDVVNLEFATISGGGTTEITAGDNITVTQPDSAGAFEIGFSNPLTNPINVNNQSINDAVFKGYSETVYTGLSTSGTLTPDVSNGNVQTVTLSGNITINSLSGVANGDSVTIIITQPSSGGPYTLSSTMKFAGGNKTLSTTANAIDVLSIFYDGTNYLASLSTNFS